MSQKIDLITIDGPAGVGKSTVSRRVAAECGYTYLDTGAMYRAVALGLHDKGLKAEDLVEINEELTCLELELTPAKNVGSDSGVILGGVDVSEKIRTPEVSMLASRFSTLAPVRKKLTQLQQKIGTTGRVVAEGRDMGTVVFPKARHKFYLDADAKIRAKRRYQQMVDKGENPDFKHLLEQTKERDASDRNRAISPLCPASDALIIDTGVLTLDEVVATILESIHP